MRFTISILFIISFLSISEIQAQEDIHDRKQITITRTRNAPEIDGKLNDPAWENAAIATNFVERTPNNGVPAPDSLKTEVRIVYDDAGIYFAASMKDPEPSKIAKELTERDAVGNDDFIIFLINGYNDRQQSLEFLITAAGVQFDAKMTNGSEDPSWNAVWYSDVEITEEGWNAEAFIPYSELRFPEKENQVWGLNIERNFRRARTRYSWSFINNEKGSFSFYDGELYGITDIETPTRLSFQPYVSSYLTNYDGETQVDFNGGMDLKYGINDAFTLDMILVPDFGQAKFDEAVLNLSAAEVRYNENRPFFTEGTELFTKGGLFYSRRVGGAPIGEVDLAEDEEIVEQPSSVDLINAVKVSGRTEDGLGIGFFNAVTKRTFAKIKNTISGESRRQLIEPLTNYNILVLDQRFGSNSSVSFVNTNTMREGNFRDANATGVYSSITNKNNTWNYFAGLEGSLVNSEEEIFGTEGELGFSEIKGKNTFGGSVQFRTQDYNINDLGYSSYTNYLKFHGNYTYRYLEPRGALNNLYLNVRLYHDRRLENDLYGNFIFNINTSMNTRDFLSFGGGFETTPFGTNDLYEARRTGWFVKVPVYYDQWFYISTDYRKRFAVDFTLDWYKYDEKRRSTWLIDFTPRFRASEKLNFVFSTNWNISTKEEGYVDVIDEDIIFGQRDRTTIVNSLNSSYILNNKTAFNLAFRHYYSEASYDRLLSLERDGDLAYFGPDNQAYDTSYNSWNIDLRFSWWFAPGSQMTILYRNAIESYANEAGKNFAENLNYLFDQPQLNNISLRINYYLDYNRSKNWLQEQFGRSTS